MNELSAKDKLFPHSASDLRFSFRPHPRCPACTQVMLITTVIVAWFPYVHVDLQLRCNGCKLKLLFGIPCNVFDGLGLIVWDTNKSQITKWCEELGDRWCPLHEQKMILTKVFGDWIPNPEKLVVQWKCPRCFLTKHETHPRPESVPHADQPFEFPEEVTQVVYERLRKLGYVE